MVGRLVRGCRGWRKGDGKNLGLGGFLVSGVVGWGSLCEGSWGCWRGVYERGVRGCGGFSGGIELLVVGDIWGG